MSDQQILTKAIQKAIDGGWDGQTADGFHITERGWDFDERISNYAIMFCHDFAKALWGDLPEMDIELDDRTHRPTHETLPAWKYHLQMMVIERDPIAYLGRNL